MDLKYFANNYRISAGSMCNTPNTVDVKLLLYFKAVYFELKYLAQRNNIIIKSDKVITLVRALKNIYPDLKDFESQIRFLQECKDIRTEPNEDYFEINIKEANIYFKEIESLCSYLIELENIIDNNYVRSDRINSSLIRPKIMHKPIDTNLSKDKFKLSDKESTVSEKIEELSDKEPNISEKKEHIATSLNTKSNAPEKKEEPIMNVLLSADNNKKINSKYMKDNINPNLVNSILSLDGEMKNNMEEIKIENSEKEIEIEESFVCGPTNEIKLEDKNPNLEDKTSSLEDDYIYDEFSTSVSHPHKECINKDEINSEDIKEIFKPKDTNPIVEICDNNKEDNIMQELIKKDALEYNDDNIDDLKRTIKNNLSSSNFFNNL